MSTMTSMMGLGARSFQGHGRAITTDGYTANFAAESALAVERHGDPSIHKSCLAHGVAGTYNKTFAPVDSFISGIIHIALSLGVGSSMSRFRHCLRLEISSRWSLLHGWPPASAVAWKRRVLRMFVTHGNAIETRQTLLALCPNGEWRSQRVEFYLPTDGSFKFSDEDDIREFVLQGLMRFLLKWIKR